MQDWNTISVGTGAGCGLPIDRQELRRLAGTRTFKRGEPYAKWGLVMDFPQKDELLGGVLVAGTRIYRSGLRRESELILFGCDCPMGLAGKFCKHVVAAGLYRLEKPSKRRQFGFFERRLEQAINTLGKSEPEPFGRLWRECVMAELDNLLAGGHARQMLDLIDRGLSQMVEARWGWMENHAKTNDQRQYAKELCERRVAACRIVGLKAEAAADRLLRRQLQLAGDGFDSGWLSEMLQTGFAECFGERWIGIYRERVEKLWLNLSRIEDRHLALVERRQRDWLARQLEQRVGAETNDFNPTADRKEAPVSAARLKFIGPARRKYGQSSRIEPDDSELVRIRLEKGEVEEAWRAAQLGGCSDELWLKLASLRIRQQPEDALAVYRRLIEKRLREKNLYAYAEAERLLRRARRLMKRLGRADDFAPYLEGLWKTYGRQRHLAAVFERL